MTKVYKKIFKMFTVLLLLASLLPQATTVQEVRATSSNWTSSAVTGWYNTTDSSFTINTATQLAGLAVLVNTGNDFLGKTITLGANINLEENEWTPIGYRNFKTIKDDEGNDVSVVNKNKPFKGTFDGNGFKITGLTINSPDSDYVGLFGLVADATIEKVVLEDVLIAGKNFVGSLIGYAQGESIVSSSSVTAGVVTGAGLVGGLIGQAFGEPSNKVTVEESYASVAVNGLGSSNSIGGLIGGARDTIIHKSYASGAVTGSSNERVGGLIGNVFGTSTIARSYATGTVISNNKYVGGLIGYAYENALVTESYASGDVRGTENVGGLIGGTQNKIDLTKSYASGDISGTKSVGGLVGWLRDNSSVENSYATGSVTGTADNVGGLIGLASGSTNDVRVNVTNSYAIGIVTGPSINTGGLIGFLSGNFVTITNSFWDTVTSGLETSTNGAGKVTTEMHNINTYLPSWNIVSVTEALLFPSPYPVLRWTTNLDEGTIWVMSSVNDPNPTPEESTPEEPSPEEPTPVEPSPFTITFNLNNGQNVMTQSVVSGTELTLPTPQRPGYSFDGWHWDSQLSMRFSETTMPYGDIGVFAKWELNQQVTYVEVNALNIRATNLKDVVKVGSLEGVESVAFELEAKEVLLPNNVRQPLLQELASKGQSLVKTVDLALFKTITQDTGVINKEQVSEDELLAKVKVMIPTLSQDKVYEIMHINEDGNIEYYPTTLQEIDGVMYIVFETSKLATYGLVEVNEDFDLEETTPATSESANIAWWLLGLGLLMVSNSKERKAAAKA